MFENADTAKLKMRELYCKVETSPVQVAIKQYSWTVEEDGIQKPIPLVKNRSLALNSNRKLAYLLTADTSVLVINEIVEDDIKNYTCTVDIQGKPYSGIGQPSKQCEPFSL